ncbi:hypothetical protein ABMB67_002141 [Halalkalibacter oceani]
MSPWQPAFSFIIYEDKVASALKFFYNEKAIIIQVKKAKCDERE